MWRWLHSLPRAIRNQFHPTGASAGVCVENEKDTRLNNTQQEVKPDCWKVHCKARGHSHNGKRRRCGRGHFWWPSHGPAVDPLKTGPVVTAGLQTSHTQAVGHGDRTDSVEERRKNCLYYRITAALPTWSGLGAGFTRHIVPPDKGIPEARQDTQSEATKQPAVETLEAAFANFEAVCKRYTAVGKGMMASGAAKSGLMSKAVELWQESSKLGYEKSQFNLAVCYETGRGVEKDMGKAIFYYRQAAEGDHPEALYNLALLYMEGAADLTQDLNKGLALLTRAADLGQVQAQKYLGVYYSEDNKDMTKAIYYLTKAADQKDSEAQQLLGMCYESGYGVEENACKAAHWYSLAANSGSPEAMYNLASFHQQGLGGLPVSHNSAKALYQTAAALGHEGSAEKLKHFDQDVTKQFDSSVDMASLATKTLLHHTEPLCVDYLLKMNSCVSAPCLTDLIRQDIGLAGNPQTYDPISPDGTRSQIFSQLMVPRALTELPSLKVIQKKRGSISDDDGSGSDSGVSFCLGLGEEEEEGERNMSPPGSPRGLISGHTLHRRNSTMPDLQVVIKR